MACVHVAVEKRELDTAQRCAPAVLHALLPLLAKLGGKAGHPGLLKPHAIDSIGFYLDDGNASRAEASRAQLTSGQGVRVEFRSRRFDVMLVEASDRLSTAQRRQCVAIRGTNEVARRLDASERGGAEVLVTLPSGAALSLRQSKRPERMVLLVTSVTQKKKALDAVLDAADVPQLLALFHEAARKDAGVGVGGGGGGVGGGGAPPSALSRRVPMERGAFWVLPSWYAEACAVVAQDVFRLHALVSATSQDISRALFVDRVTAHRVEGGPVDTHRTLLKAVLHRASGGCACALHKATPPAQKFQRLELRWEFCGCALDAHGRCARHYLAERPAESTAFPKTCMAGLVVQLRCLHEEGAGIRVPLRARDPKMELGFAARFLLDLAACGARLMAAGAHADLEADAAQLLQELETQRLLHNHVGDTMLQRDVSAVYLLRTKAAVSARTGRFVGRVRADCNAILKTHRHLFKTTG